LTALHELDVRPTPEKGGIRELCKKRRASRGYRRVVAEEFERV